MLSNRHQQAIKIAGLVDTAIPLCLHVVCKGPRGLWSTNFGSIHAAGANVRIGPVEHNLFGASSLEQTHMRSRAELQSCGKFWVPVITVGPEADIT